MFCSLIILAILTFSRNSSASKKCSDENLFQVGETGLMEVLGAGRGGFLHSIART